MKILCYTDNHFSEKSSIITKYGSKYTLRLQNQIQSLNWVEEQAEALHCQIIVCLGDFFDHAHLTDQELTALQEIKWSNIPHYFLVGNHESEENDLQYCSTMALRGENREIINEPILLNYPNDQNGSCELELAFLPYILESNRKPITEYFSENPDKLRLLFSHNDILGLQLGPVVSRTGFSIEALESVCHLCLNGHLHNGTQVSSKVINLGNLTGKDFSEDASKYNHKVMFIDTEAMTVNFIENPHAFNFYKIEINSEADFRELTAVKTNAVVSVKCKDRLVKQIRDLIEATPNILDSRIIITKDPSEAPNDEFDIASLCVDQCEKFAECCRAKLDNTDILEAELAEILK